MKYLISLIIPVYNVEKYIKECFRSVLQQLPEDCEVICVDDGSTDDSIASIKTLKPEFKTTFVRVSFISQENQGVSIARNKGVDIAKGRYLSFLDPDDMISNNYFERLKQVIKEFPDVSIVCFNAWRFNTQESSSKNQPYKLHVHSGEAVIYPKKTDAYHTLVSCFGIGQWFPWARIYEHSLFKIARFEPGLKFQDLMLIPELYLNAHLIVNIDDILVAYRYRPDSGTARPHSATLEHIDRIIDKYSNSLVGGCKQFVELQNLVVLSCLYCVFYVSKNQHGVLYALIQLRRRQARVGFLLIIRTLIKNCFKIPYENIVLQISPICFLGHNFIRRQFKKLINFDFRGNV